MIELKSLALGTGEKKDFPNFDDPKEISELVTGTNLLRQSSASYKCGYWHPLRDHILITWRKHTEKVRYPALRNTVMIGDYPTMGTRSFRGKTARVRR